MTRAHGLRAPACVCAWFLLAFAVAACVEKPAFQCQSDESCVKSDGSRGTCEANGLCSFHAPLSDAAGASGSSASLAGSNGDAGEAPSTGGDGGSAGQVATGQAGGDASGGTGAAGGASCMNDASGCYSCSPKTTEQFLNACTSAKCVPFDDHARITTLTANGDLPPLPPISGQ